MKLLDLIGKPWAVPCDPPDTFDCWELVLTVRAAHGLRTDTYVERAARQPHHRTLMEEPPKGWRRLDTPSPLCVARMAGGRHVGVVMPDMRHIMHCEMFTGVRVDTINQLRMSDEITFWEMYHG